MLFTSLIFLYLFLPVTLIVILISNPKFRNPLLLLASLVFYAWAGVSFVSVIIGSILINYLIGLRVGNTASPGSRKFWFILGVTMNILGLVIFKYSDFLLDNLNILTSLFKFHPLHLSNIVLPLGISFFTFRGICYLITVKRNELPPNKNIIDLGLYLSFFPALIAGPIDRYRHIEPQLTRRKINATLFARGVNRIAIGLAKKVIISAPLAYVADHIFSTDIVTINMPLAWLGAFSYMLQIYYDFSGYTDMAIGLGQLFGFQLSENFDFPYISRSIQEFWRRWHMTLSSWLRDYLFLPLAYSTSRKLKRERYIGMRVDNMIYGIAIMITFFICGFWHGAAWNYIVWGVVFGLLLFLEKTWLGKKLRKGPKVIGYVYTLLFVLLAWVIFRSPNLKFAAAFLKIMFGIGGAKIEWIRFTGYADREFLVMAIIAILGCTKLFSLLLQKLKKLMSDSEGIKAAFAFHGYYLFSALFIFFVLTYSTMSMITGTLQPFIYFKF
jgi:alginate O-acetyltransferase complex protein AlgI